MGLLTNHWYGSGQNEENSFKCWQFEDNLWGISWNVDNLKIIYGEMVDFLLSGHLVDNIMIMCGENVDFLNKFPTFSLSTNCKPAPFPVLLFQQWMTSSSIIARLQKITRILLWLGFHLNMVCLMFFEMNLRFCWFAWNTFPWAPPSCKSDQTEWIVCFGVDDVKWMVRRTPVKITRQLGGRRRKIFSPKGGKRPKLLKRQRHFVHFDGDSAFYSKSYSL